MSPMQPVIDVKRNRSGRPTALQHDFDPVREVFQEEVRHLLAFHNSTKNGAPVKDQLHQNLVQSLGKQHVGHEDDRKVGKIKAPLDLWTEEITKNQEHAGFKVRNQPRQPDPCLDRYVMAGRHCLNTSEVAVRVNKGKIVKKAADARAKVQEFLAATKIEATREIWHGLRFDLAISKRADAVKHRQTSQAFRIDNMRVTVHDGGSHNRVRDVGVGPLEEGDEIIHFLLQGD